MTRAIPFRERVRRPVVAALVGAMVATATIPAAPGVAHAQSQDDLNSARSLFREGLALEAAGNWAAALGKFQEVRRVKLTPQVRFHIARCQEHLGRLSEALGEYRLAEYEAGAQDLTELESITEARQGLEARIPKVIITRGEGASDARVQLDGVELGDTQIGEAVNVDPGPHRVTARLPDGTQFEQPFTAKIAETAAVELVLPEALRAQAAAPTTAGSPAAADRGAPSSGPGPLPFIIGGVGVASPAASGVFFVLRNGAASDLDEVCRDSVCPASLEGTQSRGETYALLSTVTLGVGIVGVGVATYLFLAGGSSGERAALAPPIDVGVATTGREGAVTVRGRF
jgi:hypothetical protein